MDLGVHYDIGGYGASLVVEKLRDYQLVLAGSMELKQEACDFITKGQRKGYLPADHGQKQLIPQTV